MERPELHISIKLWVDGQKFDVLGEIFVFYDLFSVPFFNNSWNCFGVGLFGVFCLILNTVIVKPDSLMKL